MRNPITLLLAGLVLISLLPADAADLHPEITPTILVGKDDTGGPHHLVVEVRGDIISVRADVGTARRLGAGASGMCVYSMDVLLVCSTPAETKALSFSTEGGATCGFVQSGGVVELDAKGHPTEKCVAYGTVEMIKDHQVIGRFETTYDK